MKSGIQCSHLVIYGMGKNYISSSVHCISFITQWAIVNDYTNLSGRFDQVKKKSLRQTEKVYGDTKIETKFPSTLAIHRIKDMNIVN